MHTIYIGNRPLRLVSREELAQLSPAPPHELRARYTGKAHSLLSYADTLEKQSPQVRSITIYADDGEQLWADFQTKYRWVPAAGGVVRHTDGRVLMIYRRGYWDLPKGKIDDGESQSAAALREVEEETGLTQLTLGQALPTTYHTYFDQRERRVLKPTYWFGMTTAQDQLQPQQEEDIERAEWVALSVPYLQDLNIYPALRLLLEDYLQTTGET